MPACAELELEFEAEPDTAGFVAVELWLWLWPPASWLGVESVELTDETPSSSIPSPLTDDADETESSSSSSVSAGAEVAACLGVTLVGTTPCLRKKLSRACSGSEASLALVPWIQAAVLTNVAMRAALMVLGNWYAILCD